MLGSIQQALGFYTKKPLLFMKSSLFYVFWQLTIFFALLGILIIGFVLSSLLNQSPVSPSMGLFYFIVVLALVYFCSALYGSLINSYWNATKTISLGLLDFYRYALNNGLRFFWITLAKLLVELLFLLPLAVIYFIYVMPMAIQYSEYAVGVLAVLELLIIGLLFSGAPFVSALTGMNARDAIRTSFGFVKKKHVIALVFFGILCFITLTTLVPLVQLIALFILYPVILTAYSVFVNNTMSKK